MSDLLPALPDGWTDRGPGLTVSPGFPQRGRWKHDDGHLVVIFCGVSPVIVETFDGHRPDYYLVAFETAAGDLLTSTWRELDDARTEARHLMTVATWLSAGGATDE